MKMTDQELRESRDYTDRAHRLGFYRFFPPCDPEDLKMKPGETLTEEQSKLIKDLMEELDKELEKIII
jgi:hypothetical protein